jgi:hypothetical protein
MLYTEPSVFVLQRHPKMNKPSNRNKIVAGIIATTIMGILTNVATNIIPESARPHLWMSLPLLLIVLFVQIYLGIQDSPPPSSPSKTPATHTPSYQTPPPSPIPLISRQTADSIPILQNNAASPPRNRLSDWYDTLSFIVTLCSALIGFVIGASNGGFSGAIGGFLIGFFGAAAIMNYIPALSVLGIAIGSFLFIMYILYYLYKLITG